MAVGIVALTPQVALDVVEAQVVLVEDAVQVVQEETFLDVDADAVDAEILNYLEKVS